MNKSFLDLVGLTYLWGKIKEYVASYSSLTTNSGTVTVNIGGNSSVVPTKTSLMTNDSGFITLADVPEGATASSSTPLMDGTATVGTETAFARGDHRHPSDTSKQDVIDASHKLSADLVEDGTANKAYTAAEKDKLGGIAAGAEVNVQANWTETSTSSDAYIKNKPTLATVATSGSYDDLSNKPTIPDDSNLVHKTGNETITGDKEFQSNIEITAPGMPRKLLYNTLEENKTFNWIVNNYDGGDTYTLQQALDARNNVQADWNQTTTTAADYIKNKPSIPSASATTPKMNGEAAVGSETKWAKGDHVHPSDTSKLDTVDTISDAQINGLFVSIISFTINNETYQAEEGMTWQQWVDSEYNVVKNPYTGEGSINNGNFYVVSNEIHVKTTNVSAPHVADTSYTFVTPQDTIIANYSYKLDNSSDEPA